MNPRTRTPVLIIGVLGVLFAALAAVVPLAEIVQLVNIGTLFAFVVVNIGVIILRRTRPDLERGYRVPFVPVFPIIGAALCIYLMVDLPGATWARFVIWMAIGLVIYFAYGAGTRGCAAARSRTPRPSCRPRSTPARPAAAPPAEAGRRLAGDRGQQRRRGGLAELRRSRSARSVSGGEASAASGESSKPVIDELAGDGDARARAPRRAPAAPARRSCRPAR